ncbi:MAG: DNA-processing protein DprA [Paracoccaceae bacterium]|jgi:DNA processing protein
MKADLFSYPIPDTPHTPEEDDLSVLRLIRSRRVGPATYHRLIGEYGSARAALAALPEIARASGVRDYTACPEGVAMVEMKAARRAGARLLRFGTPAYPAALAGISDAPPLLWTLGDPGLAARPMIALVGARNASSLGLRMARRLAQDMAAAGFVVVSGLARGIDTAAHKAALEGGTIAALAGGVDVIYPSENAGLAADIAQGGLLLSEQPMGCQPQARHFPLRNRLIAGLARAVVVVEAAAGSGSLITARIALDQGREVLSVPGHPLDARAAGCNALIRDGAVLVRGIDDILSALGTEGITEGIAAPERPRRQPAAPRAAQPAAAPPAPALPPDALRTGILDRLGPSPVAEDQLIRDLRTTPARLAPVLLALEFDGIVQRQPGGMIALAVG